MNIANDTICALATPAGGAIGIIRISGPLAIQIADGIFCSARSGIGMCAQKLHNAKTQTVHYGTIADKDGSIIDDVLVTLFIAPHSYTGENCVEISCHGSRYILNNILRILVDSGCRMAEPGEYTRRAFLNGKMDLSQAEAVADLISATNQATHRLAMGQLRGNISSELAGLREQLLRMTSLLELELDFSDHEELEFASRTELLALAQAISRHITRLTSTFISGKAIKQGIPVAIVGKTNVGKSTLLNMLVGDEKAIVSNIHGTTRDVIEDVADINGVAFRFIDTAGIRSTEDEIERIGIERTYLKISEAAIVLWLVDSIPTADEIKEMMRLCSGKNLLIVNNKTDVADLTPKIISLLHLTGLTKDVAHNKNLSCGSCELDLTNNCSVEVIGISARNNDNIENLCNIIYRLADIPAIQENDVILTSSRHYDSLIHANESIMRVIDGLDNGLSGDLISEDLNICLDYLSEITGGLITTSEVLENIFRHFCIGK